MDENTQLIFDEKVKKLLNSAKKEKECAGVSGGK